MTWSQEVMERFERGLSRLAVKGNVKARVVFRDVAQSRSLDEKQDKVAAWRAMASSNVTLGRLTQETPSWQEVLDFIDAWYANEGAPSGGGP